MPSLFRRKSQADATDLVEPAVEEVDGSRPRAVTPKKGRETPKRQSDQRRRVAATPLTKEEQRERRRQASREMRTEGAPRDRTPERVLVRDIVDSRRSIGNYFLLVMLVILFLSTGAFPPIVRAAANITTYVLMVSVVVDSIVLSRKIKRVVSERVPGISRFGGLYYYGIARNLSFRRMRMPTPRVKPGDKI